MRNLLTAVALTTALAVPAAFAADQQPAQPPSGQYEKTSPQKGEADNSKMASADFAVLDRNKDGKITEDEVPADSPVASHFAMLDTDKDGALSKAEFRKAHSMMR